jgi:virginiamycin B lyase
MATTGKARPSLAAFQASFMIQKYSISPHSWRVSHGRAMGMREINISERRSPLIERYSAALFIALALIFFSLVSQAKSAIYWGSTVGIGRVNLDGTYFEREFIPWSLADYNFNPCGLAINGTHIYWADPSRDAIGQANLDGTEPNFTFITGTDVSCGVALSGSHVFWANTGTGGIGRARLDGSQMIAHFADATFPCGVAVGGEYVYWASNTADAVGRVKLDGSESTQALVGSTEGRCGVAVSGSHVYWGAPEAIGRANLDGTERDPEFIADLNLPCSLAIHAGHLYWTEEMYLDGFVARALLDGTGVDRSIVGNLSFPCGIALNSASFVPRQPQSSLVSTFFFGNARQVRRRWAAFVAVDLPEPGTLRAYGESPGVEAEVLPEDPDSTDSAITKAGRRWLRVWPATKGAAGKKLRKRIQRRGRARTAIKVEYAATGRLPATKSKRVWLVRSPSGGTGKRRDYCSLPALSRRSEPGLHVRVDLRGRLFRHGDHVVGRLENVGSLDVSYQAPFDIERRNDWSWTWPGTPDIAWPQWRRELPSGFAGECMSFTIREDFPPGDYFIRKRIEYRAPWSRQTETLVTTTFSVLP